MREASFHFYSAACRRSERGKKGRRGKVRKKAWPKERGQRASGAALGARKKAVGVLGGDHETSRVIPRWNLVKQSSLETTRTRTLLRGPPGCLIKIEVVRCFSLSLSLSPPPSPCSLESLTLTRPMSSERREERAMEKTEREDRTRGNEPRRYPHGLTDVCSPLHGFHGEACVSSTATRVSFFVLFRDATRVYIYTFTRTRISYFRLCVRTSVSPSVCLLRTLEEREVRARASERASERPFGYEYGSDTFLRQINKTKP